MRIKKRLSIWAITIALFSVSEAFAMSLTFKWGPTKSCFDRNSPPIRLSGVPKGTSKISFRMVDLDAPGYNHGGAVLKYRGKNVFPYGAFKYKGPCPPTRHRYRITATAYDKKGKSIARASAIRTFP